MAVIGKNYAANVVATQLLSITATEQFFDVVPVIDGYHGCLVQLGLAFVATPTDNIIVSVYTRQNGVNWDTVPRTSFKVTAVDGATAWISFDFEKAYEFRVGVKTDGTTDTEPSADMNSMLWKWSSV